MKDRPDRCIEGLAPRGRGLKAGFLAAAVLLACTGDRPDIAGPIVSSPLSVRLSVSRMKVEQGWYGHAGVTVTRPGSYSGPVSVTTSGLPSGVGCRGCTIASGHRECVVELTVGRAAQPGTYPLTIQAAVPDVAPVTATLTLEIVPSWFELTARPTSVIVQQNDATGTIVIDVEETEQFNRFISVNVSGAPPGLEPTIEGRALSATVTRDVAPGSYTLTVTGTATDAADQTVSIDVNVVAEAPPVTAVEPRIFNGGSHACGITSDGTPYCWGGNTSGQLGDGTTVNRLTPVAVSGGLKLMRMALGAHHTCGLTTDGYACCWGSNNVGQLGDSTTVGPVARVLSPRPVSGGHVFTEIAAGASHTCALTPLGKAYCWGENWTGALGDGTTIDRAVPVPVSGGMTFTSIVAAGARTCALDRWGSAYCWGQNYPGGQLGDGTIVNRSTPTAVAGIHGFASLSDNANCGLTPSGTAWCWGDGSLHSSGTVPTPVPGDLRYVQFNGTCGLTISGSAVCRGAAPVGDGTSMTHSVFVAVSGGLTFARLAGGRCGVTADGTAWCWGSNLHGEVGDGTLMPRLAPVPVHGNLDFHT